MRLSSIRGWRHITLALAMSVAGCAPSQKAQRPADSNPKAEALTPEPSRLEKAADLAEGMQLLRQKALTAPAADFGLKPNDEFPKVYGALAEFPMSDGTATIASFRDGNASLYTTGTFGVIGGAAYEGVRGAATEFVRAAQKHYDEAKPTTEFPYPEQGRVRFYLLTFDGVRVIDAELESLASRKSKNSELFEKANYVMTELRKVVPR